MIIQYSQQKENIYCVQSVAIPTRARTFDSFINSSLTFVLYSTIIWVEKNTIVDREPIFLHSNGFCKHRIFVTISVTFLGQLHQVRYLKNYLQNILLHRHYELLNLLNYIWTIYLFIGTPTDYKPLLLN